MNELWFEKALAENAAKLAAQVKADINQIFSQHLSKEENKEESTMKVSYKGVTGELVRLEHVEHKTGCGSSIPILKWELDVWDVEKGCKVSFTGASLKDVKFLGGEVTYG